MADIWYLFILFDKMEARLSIYDSERFGEIELSAILKRANN